MQADGISSMDKGRQANDFEDILEQNYTKLIENETLSEAKLKEEPSTPTRTRTKSTYGQPRVEKRGRKRKSSNEAPPRIKKRGRKRLKSHEEKRTVARDDLESFISSELAKFNNETETNMKTIKEEPIFKIKENKCNFTCHCAKSFRSQKSLEEHMRVHTGEKPHKCDECGKSFTQRVHLNQHKRTHTGEKPYECSECRKCFSKSGHLSRHMQIHLGLRPFKCDVCDKAFIEMAILKRHYMIHTGEKPFTCDHCDKAYNQLTSLKLHMKTAHPTVALQTEEKKTPEPAKSREEFFNTIEELKVKISAENNLKRLQQRKLLTRDDLESFISSELSLMNADSRIEQEPEPVVEEVLVQEVVVKERKKRVPKLARTCKNDSSKIDKRFKPGIKELNHKCNECGTAYRFLSQLKRHQIKHTGERPFLCAVCSKAYSKSSHLKRHEKIHSGEKEFECPDCDKSFIELAMLKRHEMVHSGMKPYSCEFCNKSFNQLQALQIHYKRHLAKKYPCSMCAKSFRREKSLREHMSLHTYKYDSFDESE